jgi:hypothetical protein
MPETGFAFSSPLCIIASRSRLLRLEGVAAFHRDPASLKQVQAKRTKSVCARKALLSR